MQPLEITVLITVLLLMFFCFRAFKADMETPSVITNEVKSQGFWTYEETFIASYISRYLENSEQNQKLLALLYKSIGRSKPAIARKISRFDNAYSKANDLSHLDNRVHENIESMTEFEAFANLIRNYEKLGGNPRVLENHLL